MADAAAKKAPTDIVSTDQMSTLIRGGMLFFPHAIAAYQRLGLSSPWELYGLWYIETYGKDILEKKVVLQEDMFADLRDRLDVPDGKARRIIDGLKEEGYILIRKLTTAEKEAAFGDDGGRTAAVFLEEKGKQTLVKFHSAAQETLNTVIGSRPGRVGMMLGVVVKTLVKIIDLGLKRGRKDPPPPKL